MVEDQKRGGTLLVEALEAQGAERVFCVPGESYLDVLDALYDATIPVTLCRQEGGAAMMAEAYGKMTGKPGICMVTRGPGATNASAGVHVAQQDSTPMILFVGQIATTMRERDAFQEINYRQMFGGIAKWVAEIDHPDRVPEFVSRAYHVATSGRPGPVVLALPEDMLIQPSIQLEPDFKCPPMVRSESYASPQQMSELKDLLEGAKNPIAILGGSRWTEEAREQIMVTAEKLNLPVACSFRRQMLFDNLHPCYAGDVGIGINPNLFSRIVESDLVLLIGDILSEMPSQGYTIFGIPDVANKLVHVHPGSEEIGRMYVPSLALNISPAAFCEQFAALDVTSRPEWEQNTKDAHEAYLKWSGARPKVAGDLQMAQVMEWIENNVAQDAIFTNGAGNYATWVHRFHRFRTYNSQLAPTSGSMGYGLPAAVAAKLKFPERDVICFAGDGCLQMTLQELGTAAQEGANIIVVVVDNGIYGTIRMHQEREYPGRISATTLKNPDFAALANAYGYHTDTVRTADQFGPAFEAAKASGKPALLHLHLDPEAITPARSLTQIREASLAAMAEQA